MIPTWSQTHPKMVPQWSQNNSKRIPKWSQYKSKMIPTWSQHDPKMIPKWSKNDPKIIPKWFQHLFTIALVIERKKLSPEARKQTRASESLKIRSTNQFYVSQHFVHYSPGDRAQKVIPGGAKTNESLWKSHNKVKQSILRFPAFCSL